MKSLMIIAAAGVVSMGLWSVVGQESPAIDPVISTWPASRAFIRCSIFCSR